MTLTDEDFVQALTQGRCIDFAVSCLDSEKLKEFEQSNNSSLDPLEVSVYKFGDWLTPKEYQNLDLLTWLLDRCTNDAERDRVNLEWQLYEQKGLVPVLAAVKYIVDTMRDRGLVWGVGRGSSVASYVLYLLGAHKINSMEWDLDPTEFLR